MTSAPTEAPKETRPVTGGLGGQRLPSLTGMRALAGLSVFVTHALALGIWADPMMMLKHIHYGGNAGMFGLGFFFVLTGFVVTWTASSKDTARRFWRRRFFKLFPNHVLVYFIILALWIPTDVPVKFWEFLAGLLLVSAWFPGDTFLYYNLNGPMWSANIDVIAYAAFPFLYMLIKKIPPRLLWHSAVGVVVLAAVIPAIGNMTLPDHPPSLVSPDISWPRQWFAFYFPLTRSLEFVVGIIMARIVLTGQWIRLGALPAALLTFGTYLATLKVPIFHGYTVIPTITMALLIPAMAMADVKGRRTFVNSKPMVWLGERMYAFFVIHINVMFSVHALFNQEWGVAGTYTRKSFGTGTAILVLIGLYLLCLLLASILYALVERPAMRRWSRPKSERRPRPAATTVPAAQRPVEAGT